MRSFVALLCFFCVCPVGTPVHGQIDLKVSEISGAERLVSSQMRPVVVHSYAGDARYRAEYEAHPEDGTSWRLSFYGFAPDTTALSLATTAQFTVDGRSLSPEKMVSKTRTMKKAILEVKHVSLSSSAFRTIATAGIVTVQMGPTRFELPRPSRADMRRILDRVPIETGAPVADRDSAAAE